MEAKIFPPDPNDLYFDESDAHKVFLRPLLMARPNIKNIEIGEYTYYSDFSDPSQFFEQNILHNYCYSNMRLSIGRYCSLAHGTTFMMEWANHVLAGPSTYPFPGSWSEALPVDQVPFPKKGDTVVGNDVWFGHECLILPGVKIGNGAVIGARTVVSRDVPDYAIVVGNPGRVVKYRFTDKEISRLHELAWWNWPTTAVLKAIPIIVKGNISELETFASEQRLLPNRDLCKSPKFVGRKTRPQL